MEDLTPASVAERLLRLGERCDALAVVAAMLGRLAKDERAAQRATPPFSILGSENL